MKVIIIGAGIAGLSAGCYLQMNGYDTEIFEMHNRPGGLCTAWKRKEYTIDGCLHWFVGCNPSSSLYAMWNELIDMQNYSRETFSEFCSVKIEDKTIRLLGNVDALTKELMAVAPEDKKEIHAFADAIRKFSRFEIPAGKAMEVMTLGEKISFFLKNISMFAAFAKWKMPVSRYAEKFKSQAIRKLLTTAYDKDTPMLIVLMNQSWFNNRNAGYPAGGAQELSSRIVKRYLSLGGKIHTSAKVSKILTDKGCANGIMLSNGKTMHSEHVVSAADGRDTVIGMLDGKYTDKNIQKLYHSGKYEPGMSFFYVSLGIKKEFNVSHKPYLFLPLLRPLKIDKKEIRDVGLTIHNFDPMSAPKGKTVITMMLESRDPKYWLRLREEDRKGYEKKKAEIAERMVEELSHHFGSIRKNIEVLDVATPATYVRYTNNWNGAPMGWQDPALFIRKPKKWIKGLENFYMCGQWVGDGGLPMAAKSGRDVCQMICRKDGQEFRANSFQ